LYRIVVYRGIKTGADVGGNRDELYRIVVYRGIKTDRHLYIQ